MRFSIFQDNPLRRRAASDQAPAACSAEIEEILAFAGLLNRTAAAARSVARLRADIEKEQAAFECGVAEAVRRIEEALKRPAS